MLLLILGSFFVISFLLNDWFCETMPRHQLLQLPAMLALGIIGGVRFSNHSKVDVSWDIAILIFVFSSLAFWMIPRSVDSAVIHVLFNRLMHINMFVAGFLLIRTLRNTLFEIKTTFFWMLSAMTIATGMALKTFNVLLCSAFTIEQQKETGFYLIIIGLGLLVSTLFVFVKGLEKR